MNSILLTSVLIPIEAGILLLALNLYEKQTGKKAVNGKMLHALVTAVLLAASFFALYAAWTGDWSLQLFELVDGIRLYFHVDAVGRIFVTVLCIVWVLAGVYSFVYMEHEGAEKFFYGFYLLCFGVLIGLCFAGNMVTYYLFFELMTLTSMPMVLHNGSREAIMAALKYLFFSMCGAYAALFGIFVLNRYCVTDDYFAGGTLDMTLVSGHETICLIAVMAMLIGFGVKAGMLPLHAWLPTAHPVAPSPASSVLSAIIVKFGVLAMVRTVFYVVGVDFLRGTWVQYTWMTLSLLTVFMGSMLAYREKVFKKRLAYSTVSQASYILYGLSVMTPLGFVGAMLHTAAHAMIKSGLFLIAGVFLFKYGYTEVSQLKGLGKKMPVLMWCYTILSLALIGIPPTGGFVSKWYLAEGSLQSGIAIYTWLGPVVLLISALLTAGYLLPITLKGFFPGEKAESSEKKDEPAALMLIPIIILTALAVLIGLFPNPIYKYVAVFAADFF